MADLKRLQGNEFVFTEAFFRDGNAQLKKGDYGSDENPKLQAAVVGLQQFLRDQGLYKGDVDGKFGKGTEAAIKAFQNKNGIEPTGVVDSETFKVIAKERSPAPDPNTPEMEAAFNIQRKAAFMQVEHAVNEQHGATRKEGFLNILHNLGVSAEISTYRIPEEVKTAILQGNKATHDGVKYDFSREVLTDPEKLKGEMQKLATLCSGGNDVPDFTQEANSNASISRHVEANGPIKMIDSLIKS